MSFRSCSAFGKSLGPGAIGRSPPGDFNRSMLGSFVHGIGGNGEPSFSSPGRAGYRSLWLGVSRGGCANGCGFGSDSRIAPGIFGTREIICRRGPVQRFEPLLQTAEKPTLAPRIRAFRPTKRPPRRAVRGKIRSNRGGDLPRGGPPIFDSLRFPTHPFEATHAVRLENLPRLRQLDAFCLNVDPLLLLSLF